MKKKAKEDANKPVERKPFDRDMDLQVNRFDEAQKKALLKKSQELNTRFSHSKDRMFLWGTSDAFIWCCQGRCTDLESSKHHHQNIMNIMLIIICKNLEDWLLLLNFPFVHQCLIVRDNALKKSLICGL